MNFEMNTKNFKTVINYFILPILMAVSGYYPSATGQQMIMAQTNTSTQHTDLKTNTAHPGIPRIDEATPPVYETASFGLG